MTDFKNYQSPFTWRYGSEAMRHIWSEHEKRRLWRYLWVALAEAQAEYGLIQEDQLDDLREHVDSIDIPRAFEIEEQIHHDLMAELRTFAEQAIIGGGILHLGATSMDIEDNADVLRIRNSLDLVLDKLSDLLNVFEKLIRKYAETPLIAFTHIQPAEPSTMGYRLAQYAQDLLEDFATLKSIRMNLRGKGFKGAVGTGASFAELIMKENVDTFEQILSKKLGIPFFEVSTQTYPRKQDYTILNALSGLAQSLYKFAFDLRILQSPPIGELAEPFGIKQVGSSAMPFKRNPIRAEKIDSLGRLLSQLPRVAWDNAAHSLLERTLDDSANRRVVLPEAFLAADEMLRTTHSIIANINVDEEAMAENLSAYGPFSATERVLMASVKAGANRQEMHELIRSHSITAWQVVKAGQGNPLANLLSKDKNILSYLSPDEIIELMDYRNYTGLAPKWALKIANKILNNAGAD